VLPASAALARLADAGLGAIDATQAGHAPDAAWLATADAEIAALRAQEQASSSLFATIVSPAQPPGDLLLAVTDGVQHLVDAAAGR
jgi:hexosaminidase